MMTMENKLSIDALDSVAGGSSVETAGDSRFLNVLLQGKPDQCGRYDANFVSSHLSEIKNAWASVGVSAHIICSDFSIFPSSTKNTYEINGKAVSREQAMEHAMNVVGKRLNESDWN